MSGPTQSSLRLLADALGWPKTTGKLFWEQAHAGFLLRADPWLMYFWDHPVGEGVIDSDTCGVRGITPGMDPGDAYSLAASVVGSCLANPSRG